MCTYIPVDHCMCGLLRVAADYLILFFSGNPGGGAKVAVVLRAEGNKVGGHRIIKLVQHYHLTETTERERSSERGEGREREDGEKREEREGGGEREEGKEEQRKRGERERSEMERRKGSRGGRVV